MERLLLAGGSGFIGKNIAECLYNEFDISVVDKAIDNDFFKEFNIPCHQADLIHDDISSIIEKIAPHYIINLVSVVTAEEVSS